MQDENKSQVRELNLSDLWNIIIRRFSIIAVSFSIVFMIVAIYSFMQPDQYESSATFIIDSADGGLGSVFSSRTLLGGQQQRPIEFYQALIKSQHYIDLAMQATQTDTVLRKFQLNNEAIYNLFKNKVQLITSAKSDLVKISYSSVNPLLAYHIATIATDAFGTRCRQIELEESHKIVEFVENQKDIAKAKLEDTERSLQEFSSTGNFVIGDEEGGLLKKLIDLENQLVDVQSQRELAEANIAEYDRRLRELKAPAVTGMDGSSDPHISELRAEMDKLIEAKNKFLNDNSQTSATITSLDQQIDVKKKEYLQTLLADNRQKDTGSILDQTLLDQLRESRIKEELNLYLLKNRENLFRQWVERYRRENPKIVERAIEEARMKRGKTVYENLYNILLEKGEEARIKSATGSGGIRIIDEPFLPTRPVPSKVPRNLALGFVLGLCLGLGLALAIEYFDNSIHYKEDINQKLGLTVIGAIPEIMPTNHTLQSKTYGLLEKIMKQTRRSELANAGSDGYHDHLIFSLRPRDPIIDSYRTLRTNLQFTGVDKPLRTLLITSSLPREGKTLTSANLAISYAEFGHRVLIIDGDMRKPKQHDIFNIKISPGLSDYLARGMSLKDVIYPTKSDNLKVLPCGTLPPNPSEMVGSLQMGELIQKVSEKFDLVIIDSPPVQIVSDAMLLATKVSYVTLVVKFGLTQLRDIQETLDILERVKAPILGVIFNGIKVSRGYGTHYKYNYYYSYSNSGEKRKNLI